MSLLELILAITILATAATYGIRRTADNHDRQRRATDRVAVDTIASMLAGARRTAMLQGSDVTVTASRTDGRWFIAVDADGGHVAPGSEQRLPIDAKLRLVGSPPPVRFDAAGSTAAPVRWTVVSADNGTRDRYRLTVSPVSGSVDIEAP